MIHAYRLVYPLHQHVPPQLWEYEQPYIDNLLLKAWTFARWVVQGQRLTSAGPENCMALLCREPTPSRGRPWSLPPT
jgi:hypothetical protein